MFESFGQRREPGFCSFLIFDIGVGPDPLVDFSRGISDRHGARNVPAIEAIRASKPKLGLIGFTALAGAGPSCRGSTDIVRVDQDRPAVAVQGPGRRVAVGVGAVIEPIELAVDLGGPDMVGHRLGQQTKPRFARLYRLLGNLARCYVQKEYGKALRSRPPGAGFVPPVGESRNVNLELYGLPGVDDPRVRRDQFVLNAGYRFTDGAACRGGGRNSRLFLEGRIKLGKPEVDHAAGSVADGFSHEEAFMHFFEESAPPRFADLGLPPCFLDLCDVVGNANEPPRFDPGGGDDFASPRDPIDLFR